MVKKGLKLKISIIGLLVFGFFFGFRNNSPLLIDNTHLSDKVLVNETEQEIKMIAVGDIMLSRGVEGKMIANEDYRYPFLKTADITKNADIVFGNLETVIVTGRRIQDNEMVFKTDPKAAEGLNFAGFNVLSLANNHIMNFGKDDLESTIKILDENNISHIGAGVGNDEIYKYVVKEVNETKFAFLAFTYNSDQRKTGTGDVYGVANMDVEKMKVAVQEASKVADIVIVSMHAGIEYQISPSLFQENFSRNAIDAGADLVIGHHPHVVQTVEVYQDKYIIYSLGNFVFDQMWSNETRLGAIAEIIFQDKKIISLKFIPVKSYDYSQPIAIEGAEAEKILGRLRY
ncbi:MAG: CapA family protein [Candidatus Pacebacteria bacterium]|nr:CapA family protein [Candidatus Paceibacterota bacterium]